MALYRRQRLTDLTVLHGYCSSHKGFEHFTEALALATQALFPKQVLSQHMQKEIDAIPKKKR